MPILASLNEDEAQSFLHLLRNKDRPASNNERRSNLLIDNACSDELKKELAQVSEDENFAVKNRYLHQKQTMNYMDAKRMPID